MRWSLLMILLFWGLTVGAQELTTTMAQEIMDNVSTQPYFQTEMEFDNRYKGVLGSPFLFEDWQPGQVLLTDGKSFEGEFNYDMHSDQLVFARGGKQGYTVKKQRVARFIIKGQSFVKHPEAGYLMELNQGRVRLLSKRHKRIRKASLSTAYSTNQDYDQFIEEIEYYLDPGNQELNKAPKNVGGFTKIFPQHKDDLKRFARKHRLFLQRESDLIEMAKYCAQLMN